MNRDNKWEKKNMLNYDMLNIQSTGTTLLFFTSVSYKENQFGDILMKKFVKMTTVAHNTKKSKCAKETSHMFKFVAE
jgi:hypothetical protein